MAKINLKFLFSLKNEIGLFREYNKKPRYNTGEDDYSIFLGYLNQEILTLTEGQSRLKTEKIIKSILARESKKHGNLIKYNLRIIKEKWAKIKLEFLKQCEAIFDGHPFPKGEYKAYISLWGRYVRKLDKKTLTFPCHTEYMFLVVIHELLHFMFYDYFNKNFKGQLSNEQLWDLSEIINPIIMNKEPFISWAKYPSQPYPSHRDAYLKLFKIYENCGSMAEFIQKAIVTLKD